MSTTVTTRPTVTRKAAVALAGAAVAATAIATAPTATAAPASPKITSKPITVVQLPALGVQVSGLVVPGPLFVGITARTGAKPGDVVFAAPVSPATCSTSASSIYVNIGYVNLASGRTGGVRVQPCGMSFGGAPKTATAHTGRGPVAVSVTIAPSKSYPNAGQPSLPGFGGFTAP